MPKRSKACLRTCVGCRQTANPNQMLRIVKASGNPDVDSERQAAVAAPVKLCMDESGCALGRGAWIHRNADCLQAAVKRGGFARAFKTPVDASYLTL